MNRRHRCIALVSAAAAAGLAGVAAGQAQFQTTQRMGPIQVNQPLRAAPLGNSASQTHTMRLEKLKTPFFLAPHTGGDRDFGGNGPNVESTITLKVQGGREIVAVVRFTARETKADWTTASGTQTVTLWRAPRGATITSIRSGSKSGTTLTDRIAYRDRDHADDYIVVGRGERSTNGKGSKRVDSPPSDSVVRMARVVGDKDGADAGRRTGIQVFFKDLQVTLRGARPADNSFCHGVDTQRPSGRTPGNSCAAFAGSALLRHYGHDVSHAQLWKRIGDSGNLITEMQLGTPPGTLKDRMQEWRRGTAITRIESGKRDSKQRGKAALDAKLRAGKPVILLVGWGDKAALDIYAPPKDTLGWPTMGGYGMLHYVVVDGYDPDRKTYDIVDNAVRKTWDQEYLLNVWFWNPELHTEMSMYPIGVKPGVMIF